MELISDALLIAGALGAAAYCRLLSRRLSALKDLDTGLGAAIAALSRQVDELRLSLEAVKTVGGDKAREIGQMTARAEMAAGRLELLLASLHENGARRPIDKRRDRVAERASGLAAAARADALEADDADDLDAPPRPEAAMERRVDIARAPGRNGGSELGREVARGIWE